MENQRRGGFIRVFPSKRFLEYSAFFDDDREANRLLYEYLFTKKGLTKRRRAPSIGFKEALKMQKKALQTRVKFKKIGVMNEELVDRFYPVGQSAAQNQSSHNETSVEERFPWIHSFMNNK